MQTFIVKNHWSGWRSLVSATPLTLGHHWDSSSISCCYPVWCSSCSPGNAGQNPSPQPELWQITMGWSWAGPTYNPDSGSGCCRVGQPASSNHQVGLFCVPGLLLRTSLLRPSERFLQTPALSLIPVLAILCTLGSFSSQPADSSQYWLMYKTFIEEAEHGNTKLEFHLLHWLFFFFFS